MCARAVLIVTDVMKYLWLFLCSPQYYKQLNIRIALIGLKIFDKENPFSVDGNPGEVLGRFVQWRKTELLPKLRHDVGQLIV